MPACRIRRGMEAEDAIRLKGLEAENYLLKRVLAEERRDIDLFEYNERSDSPIMRQRVASQDQKPSVLLKPSVISR